MSEVPEPAAPAQPPAPAGPQHEGWLGHVLHPGHEAAPGAAPSPLAPELAHLKGMIELAAGIIREPAFRPLMPRALELLVSAAGLAGKAL